MKRGERFVVRRVHLAFDEQLREQRRDAIAVERVLGHQRSPCTQAVVHQPARLEQLAEDLGVAELREAVVSVDQRGDDGPVFGMRDPAGSMPRLREGLRRPREVGGYFAAKKLRKELIRFFQFAKKAGFCDHNVAKDTSPVQRGRGEASGGFCAWTEGQIAQFQRHWPLGTRERAALELLLWTDQRRSDIVKMGMAQTRDGCLPIIQAKTGTKLWLPMADQLVEAIVALPPEFSDPSCFLITHKGKPFTKESFGNWFAKACDQAGLPSKCRAHGLRKATLRRIAELGMSNKEMKSVSGQKRDATLALYIESADQRALATNAIRRLSAWASEAECLTSSRKLDIGNAEDG